MQGRKGYGYEQNLSRLLLTEFGPEKRAKVIQTLYEVATDKTHRAYVSAVTLLLAYTYGRPVERLEVEKVEGRDEQVNSARISFVLAAIPAIQAKNPSWNAEEVANEAESQFNTWMASLQLDQESATVN